MNHLASLTRPLMVLALTLTPVISKAQTQVQESETLATVQETSIEKASKSSWKAGATITTESTRNDKTNEINGADIEIQPSVTYKFNDNDSLSMNPILRTVSKKDKASNNTFETVEFKYKRSGLMTEDKNGVDMSAELRSAYHIDPDFSNKKNVYGYNQFRLVSKKELSNIFSLEGKFRYDLFTEKRANKGQVKRQSKIYLTPGVRFNDQWGFTSEIVYTHKALAPDESKNDEPFIKDEDVLEVSPSLNFAMNQSLSFSLYSTLTPAKSHDQQNIIHHYGDNAVYGFVMDASFF